MYIYIYIYPSYLVWQFSNITLSGEFTNVMTLKIIFTFRFFDNDNMDLDTKTVILTALVKKLWSDKYFCKMVANVTCSHTSCI